MATLSGAVISPPEMGQDPRWAHPRPPAEKSRLQGYPRNAGVAGLNLKPILSEKSVQQRLVASDHVAERPRELPKLENPPNSAREPAKEKKPPKPGSLTARGRVEGAGPQGRPHDNSSFLRMLLDFGDVVLDDKSLQKLEVQAANTPKQREILRLLKQLQKELSGGVTAVDEPSQLPMATSMELDQLTAQAAFLEKKILKLREKLKRQARDSSQPPEGSPEAAQLEQMAAELEGLRAKKLQLEAEKEALHHTLEASGSSQRLHGGAMDRTSSNSRDSTGQFRDETKEATSVKAHLLKKLQHLQSQTKEKTTEKEVADHNAEEARKLAETVEERLRDMLLTRESERVKLEAEQELLRRKVQEQDAQIQEMEAHPGDAQELRNLREHVAELEQTLHETRQKRAELANEATNRPKQLAAVSRLLPVREPPPSTQTGLRGQGADQATRKPEQHDELPSETTLKPARPPSGAAREETESSEDVLRPTTTGAAETASLPPDPTVARPATGAAESSIQAESAEAGDSVEASEEEELQSEQLRLQLASLDKELDRVRAEGRRTEYQQRREFAETMERKRADLAQELKDLETAASGTEGDKSLLKDVETSLQKLEERQEEALRQMNREAEEKIAAMETELKALEAELGKDPYQHDLVARRQRELSGRCLLALRPADYRREEALHYICCTLGLSKRQVEVVEESCIVEGESYIDLFNAKTEPLPAAGGTVGLDDLEPEARPLIKLTLDFLASERSEGAHRERAAHTQRLMGLVRDGGSLLEDVAVVSANYLRGISALDAEGEKWCEEDAEYVIATTRTIGDRNLHVSVHQHAEPLVVRVVAIEHSKDEEYMVCFDDNDLSALLGEASVLRKQPGLSTSIVDHLLDMLRIVDGPEGFPILVALQVSQAPQTILNGLQRSGEVALAASSSLALEDLTSPTEWLETKSQEGIQKIKAAEVMGTLDIGRPMFEDVIMLSDTFFTLSVFEDVITRALRVRLQETSCCESVEALLPGRSEGGLEFRQLRMHAEAYEFRGMTVLLLVEDIDVPPGLLIRVADGGSVWSKEVRVASDHCVYHLVQVTDDDGALSYLPNPVDRQGTTISAISAQHREHLRIFAESDIPMPHAAKQKSGKALPMIGHQELQTEGDATLLQISDHEAVVAASAKSLRAEQATRRLQAMSDDTSGRLLLKMGRRLQMPGGQSTLCVLTFVEKEAPILHIALTAHELSTCRSWFLPVDSLTAFKVLGVRLQGGAADYTTRRSLASDLAEHCCLVLAATGSLHLALSAGDSSGATGQETVSGVAPVTALGIAQQELSQEEAARWLVDEASYCMAAASLQMGGAPVDVYIYDEPSAGTIAYSLNNFLVLAHETHRNIFFSMRLHDKVLAYPLQDGEQHLLEPEHNNDLLWRVLVSLDLCDSVDHHGMSGERLVMQQEAVRHLPGLVPDASGVLRPEGMNQAPSLQALPAYSMLDNPRSDLDAQAATVAIGSWQGETGIESIVAGYATRSQMSAQSEAMLGDVGVQLSVFTDDKVGAYIFKLVAASLPDECLEVQLPIGGDPTRVYLEHRSFLGSPLAIAMSEKAFPHEMNVVIFDPKSQQELQLSARSETIQPLVERSLRARLCDALETLMRDGVLVQAGQQPEWKEVPCGRELFPPDFRERCLQSFTPILAVPLQAQDQGGAAKQGRGSSNEVIFACTRYIIDMSAVQDASLLDETTLATKPLLRISLLKDIQVPEFILRVEGLANCGEGTLSHTIRARHKGLSSPTGAYGEMQRIGELRFAFLFLDDAAPRAFRVTVVELQSGWSQQMLVLDSDSPDPGSAYLSPSPSRLDLLRLFRSSVSVRRGVLTTSSSKWDGGASLARKAAAASASQHNAEAQPQTLQPQRSLLAKAEEVAKRVLRREARFVEGAEEAMLLTVMALPDATGLSLTLSQPLGGKESHLDVVNPTLRKLLLASSAGSKSLAEVLQEEALRDEVASLLLQATEIRPPLTLAVNVEKVRSESVATEEGPVEAPQLDERPAESKPDALEVQADRLLAEVDKRWNQTQAKASTGDETEGLVEGKPSLRAQVYDCSDSMQALFNSTNLRVRVTDLNTGRSATRDLHEKDLMPWVSEAGADHLLVASREADLVDAVMWHVTLPEPGGTEASSAEGVVLRSLTRELAASGRYAKGFLESTAP